MNPINALGVRVAGLTGVILVLLFSLFLGGRYLWQWGTAEAPSEHVAVMPSNQPPTDSDGDGLPDTYEKSYRTDPNQADTDGDGVNDYDELAQGKDPAIAGTQDDTRPATGENVPTIITFTDRYLAQLPAEIGREALLDRDRITAFVATNKGELLSARPSTAIRTSAIGGQEAVAKYLNAISASHNAALVAVTNDDIQKALEAQLQLNDTPMDEVVQKLEKNLSVLQTVETPQETALLHAKLLSASESLLGNVRLLQNMDVDFIGGLIGSKNIEELAPIFAGIAQEIQALETKYGLE